MKHLVLTVFAFLFLASQAWAQGTDIDTPMHFSKKFSGDQALRFASAGKPLHVKGSKLNYRLITNQNEWKKVWGYLYDDTVKVDFTKYHVVAVYKSPAKGGFTLTPKRVFHYENSLQLDVEAAWNGKNTKSHPFLFLAVDKFKKFDAAEKFLSPNGRDVHYP